MIFIISCKEKRECPFDKIDWTQIDEITYTIDKDKFNIALQAKLDAALKQNANGSIDISVIYNMDDINKLLANKKVIFDKEYVQNYNLAVSDICGTLSLLQNVDLSQKAKDEFEKQLIDKVLSLKDFVSSDYNLKQENNIKPVENITVQQNYVLNENRSQIIHEKILINEYYVIAIYANVHIKNIKRNLAYLKRRGLNKNYSIGYYYKKERKIYQTYIGKFKDYSKAMKVKALVLARTLIHKDAYIMKIKVGDIINTKPIKPKHSKRPKKKTKL